MTGRVFHNAGVFGLFHEEDQLKWINFLNSGEISKANDMLWLDDYDKITLSYENLSICYDMWVVGKASNTYYVLYPFATDPNDMMLSNTSGLVFDPIKVSYWCRNKTGGIQTMWVMSGYPIIVSKDIVEAANRLLPNEYDCDAKIVTGICMYSGV
jgi:hypothetical protein